MNKIVREHYPVDKLPEDLRPTDDTLPGVVRVTVEDVPENGPPPLSAEDAIALMRQMQQHAVETGTTVTTEEAVRRIRELRDEWDD